MKIRAGFVSNSSSSSFCLYGIALSIDTLFEFCEVDKDDFYCDEDKIGELINKKTGNNFRLECICDWDDNTIYIGAHPAILSDELAETWTFKKFYNVVEKSLAGVVGEDLVKQNIAWCEGTIYN